MLATVNHYRSLTFDDLERKVEYSEGIPLDYFVPPWRVWACGPQNGPQWGVRRGILNEVLGIQFYLL